MFRCAGPECRLRAGRADRADRSAAVSSTGTRSCRSRVPVASMHINTAVRWVKRARRDWASYLAARALDGRP
jgi:hypothetical protein